MSVAMLPRASTVALLAFALLPSPASAGAFLSNQAPAASQRGSDLLDELEGVLGGSRRAAAEGRAAAFEDAMRPIFRSLPKADGERLPASGVRYLLHRVFVERHGWFVEGLMSRGDAWNASSPAAFFAEHTGEAAESLFERRLGGAGLSLHEVAVFAATLESLVHEETLERLHAAFRVLSLDSKEAAATEHEVERVIDTYMLMLVLGLNHTTVSPSLVGRTWENIDRIYPTWHETQKWVREVRKEVVSASPETRTSFGTTTQVLEEVADRYGRWQDSECIALKEDLMQHEHGETGRVLLKDFYGAALNGSFQYTESKEYLREHGILDETNPSQPSVIIPNYVNGPSNCLASSKFYSVCCINECEALLKPLERRIGAPDALPSEIVELAERLPSASVDAPRKLDASLTQRLEEIAERHGGRVPLHGRLFAQWMHHAYPRECPFPHASGAVQASTRREFSSSFGSHVLGEEALRAEVDDFTLAAKAQSVQRVELPWTSEEELFVHLPQAKPRQGWLRHSVGVAALASMLVATLRAAATGSTSVGVRKSEKCLV
mmetsp:Transcript_14656/g.33567  ORF Transcript_14656/g.33567 Transcript_14656/m.33567 type:complete len:551 (+) Transcript_14656:39-1691(+)